MTDRGEGTTVRPVDKHVRATLGGTAAVDSRQAVLVYEPEGIPGYAFPTDDLADHIPSDAVTRLAGSEELEGLASVDWDAMDA